MTLKAVKHRSKYDKSMIFRDPLHPRVLAVDNSAVLCNVCGI